MTLVTTILLAYFATGVLLLGFGAMNLRMCYRTGSARLFTHAYRRFDAPVGFWLSVMLSIGAILLGPFLLLGSSFGFIGFFGSLL